MFLDETNIRVIAGKGGDGLVSFRRAKYLPKGGPNGGDGGRGGDVILRANENKTTLIELHSKKIFRADKGESGKTKNMHGKNAEDIILDVPVGTQIFTDDKKVLLADLRRHDDSFVAAVGGRGGFGNAHFTTSIRQAPRFAELGEPGEEREIFLQVRLVADVGVIGLPSVGKSTFLSSISSARPKIADFPFTTIIPNLGVTELSDNRTLIVCDLPGLIERASEGRGLGHDFLKHTGRNRILIHFLDISRDDISNDYQVIRKELEKYDEKLAKKKELIAFTKIDIIGEDKEILNDLLKDFLKKNKQIKKTDVFFISSVSHQGRKKLLEKAYELNLQEKRKELAKEKEAADPERIVFRPHENPKSFSVEKIKDIFLVQGKRIEQIAVQTDFNNYEAMMRLYDILGKMGIEKELLRQGAQREDKVQIGKKTISFHPRIL